ncbi:hypothetical protein PG984_008811 [Apiospora sp. TS-2023a]
MGLFSFLSRKASHDQRDLALLKAQPYNATVAALPPIRGISAPRPSRFYIGVFVLWTLTGRPLSGSLRFEASARTLESPVQGPPYRLSSKSPEEGRPILPPKVPSKEHVFTKPPPVFHERSASIRSGDSGMTRGFVDLLDAQSSINHINFHQRVQAAGGKIYGEDVADRNIRENGFNLDSPAIRAFYEEPSRTSPLPPSSGSDAGSDMRSRAKKRHSIGATLRTKSLTSSKTNTASFPERTSSVIPSIPPEYRTSKTKKNEESITTKASRRKSMPSYIVSSSADTRSRSSSTASKQYAQNQDADSFPAALQDRGKYMASVQVADEKSIKSYGSNRRSVLVKNHRDSFVLSETNSDEADFGVARRISVVYPLVVDGNRPKSVHSSGRDTASQNIISISGHPPSKRISIHSLQSPLQRNPPDISLSGPRGPTLEPGRSKCDLGSTSNLHDTTSHASAQLQAMRSPYRTRSLASSSGRGARKLDIEESIPERTSSIRHWSIDSTTATLSSLSSNPYRPHSRHTANTSVDLMPYTKGVNSSRETFGSAAYHTASENYSQPSVAALSPLTPQSGFNHNTEPRPNFNIDDELSSDDDDFSPRQPRGEGEEDLIFNPSGYGFDAGELPGLPNPLDFAACLENSRPTISSRSSRYSLRGHQAFGATMPDYDSDFLSLPTSPIVTSRAESKCQNSRFQPPRYDQTDLSDDNDNVYGSDDEDTEDELSFDIPFSRGNTPNRQPPRAMRWAGSQSGVIEEEEDLNKMVLETAAKLRREVKKANRMSGATVRRRKDSFSAKGKEAAYSARPGLYDDSDADIE